MKTASSAFARVVVQPVDLVIPVEPAIVTFSCATRPAVLESSLRTTPYARFSILAADPADEFIHHPTNAGCPFHGLARRVGAYPPLTKSDLEFPFLGGWIGFFAYESGLSIEGIRPTTQRDVNLPRVWFRLYDSAAIYAHNARQWYLTAVDWPAPLARWRPPVAERLAILRDRLREAADRDTIGGLLRPVSTKPAPNMFPEAYLEKIERAKRYIEAGDIYQVNLTQRFTVRTAASPLELYRRLRQASPSSHAAFLPWGPAAVLSASPELFLELRGGHVITRPIKGTRPRTGDPVVDCVYRRELAECAKERAELTMIIDLLRNDLGRVCSYGSVRVSAPGDIEAHPTVFHRVGTIEGDLQPGRGWLDLLLAAFPGGSITGAPKIRAMQIIDELEPTERGVYCGSIGMIGLDGSMSLNIAIRTMVQVDDLVHVPAGGAIVADSVAEREYEETLAKAAGMFRALNCTPDAENVTLEEATIA